LLLRCLRLKAMKDAYLGMRCAHGLGQGVSLDDLERDVGVVSENERAKSALLLIWPLLERKLVACILEKHAGVAVRNNLEERLKSECAEGTLWTHFILA
jgi:hypothetical protein